jgi:acyl dehydratase
MDREVTVGEELPVLVRETGFHNWNRFAAVNDEFVPIHMDDEAGRDAGYPTAFGMGNLQVSYLHNMLREWMGDDGEILELSCQFRAPNTKGQIVIGRGVVTAVHDTGDRRIVHVDVWTEDHRGAKLAPGQAKVGFPLGARS